MSKGVVQRKSYTPSRTGDLILTSIFFAEVIFGSYALWTKSEDHNDFYYFLFFLVCTAVAIKLTEVFCNTFIKNFVSGYILRDAPYNHPLSKEKTRLKFIGSMWQLVIHSSMTVVELYLLWDEPWMSRTHTCFDPNVYAFVPKDSLRIFFIAQFSIWVLTCFSHRFNSDAHAHKDYFVMYVHHLATIGLVSIADWDNNARIGLIVLLIHDASDIGIDLLKICNYLRLEGPRSFFFVETVYGMSLVLWGYFRLYLFPVEIIYNSSFFAIDPIHPDRLSMDGTVNLLKRLNIMFGGKSDQFTGFVISGSICNILLVTLFIMHIWWGALLLRILYRMVVVSTPHEAGEQEYEGASDDEDTHQD